MTHMLRLPVRRHSRASASATAAAAVLILGQLLGGCGTPAPPGGAPKAARAPSAPGAAPHPSPTAPATTPAAAAQAVTPPAGAADSPRALPGWHEDDLAGLRGALERQCASPRPPTPWPALCEELRTAQPPLRDWIATRFRARPLAGDDGSPIGLVTGYHEPELTGSLQRESAAQTPLHRRPPEALLRERPTRAQIETTDLLEGRELLWLDDPVEAFFLQVQGSGRVTLRDGRVLRVGYAGDNGRAYRAIGAVLVARGAIPAAEVDAARIKAWLRANPEQAPAVMRANPRYIFFRELPPAASEAGPPGSLGVPLTAMRSVAVDPKRVAPGALLWLDTTDPLDRGPLRRLVVAQDTGAAITGTVRADLFWGRGERAERGAGAMKQPGRLWLLEPRQ